MERFQRKSIWIPMCPHRHRDRLRLSPREHLHAVVTEIETVIAAIAVDLAVDELLVVYRREVAASTKRRLEESAEGSAAEAARGRRALLLTTRLHPAAARRSQRQASSRKISSTQQQQRSRLPLHPRPLAQQVRSQRKQRRMMVL